MSLKQRIDEDLKRAMKARDEAAVSAARLLKAAILEREIATQNQALPDEDVVKIVEKQVKQRRESADIFRKNGRDDLADREEKELAVLSGYLPARLSDAELDRLVDEAIAEVGATSMKQMGLAVKAALARAQGRADGKAVSELVKKKLSAPSAG